MVHQQGQQQCGLQILCNHENVTLQAALLPVHCLLTHHLWASAWSLPMFPFANQLTTSAHPAHIQYFINHTFTIPSTSASHQDKSVRQVFAVVKWPQVHPQQEIMGKPVQVWCHSLYEPIIDNRFLPIENISSCVIIAVDKLNEEKVIVVISSCISTIYVVSEYQSYFQ